MLCSVPPCTQEVCGHHQQQEMLDPVTQHLPGNVPSEGDGEENGEQRPRQPVHLQSEQAEAEVRPRADQQHQLGHCQHVARVEHPEQLASAQLVAKLQSEHQRE